MRNVDHQPSSRPEPLGGGNLSRLVLVCFGVWLHAADGLLVVTMMPRIVAEIGGGRFIAWTIALYEIGSIVAGAAGAYLCARHGLRAAMTGAALVYLAGCALSAVAPSMWVMLCGRLAQGLGGGGLMALSFVAISLLFPLSVMPRVMAAVSALWGVSAFIGPLVGGLFADLGSWRDGFWFFALQAAALAAWLGASTALRPAAGAPTSAEAPPVGRLSLLCTGVVAVAWAGIELSALGTPLLIAAGLLLLGLFLQRDGRAGAGRLLPPRPLDPRDGVGAALLMVLCFSTATIAFSVYGPLLMTRLHGVSALTAGYVVAASSIGWSVAAILVARAGERLDRRLIVAGMAVAAASIVGFMLTLPFAPLWLVLVAAIGEGAGFGIAWTFILRRTTLLAPAEEAARVAGALPTLQRLGYALGAAYVGIVANAVGIAEETDRGTAQAAAFWIFAACLPLVGVGLVAMCSFVRAASGVRPAREPPAAPAAARGRCPAPPAGAPAVDG